MPDPTLAELLSPATLARIDNYSFIARTAVEGFISGMHRSLYHGFGSEFFQYRSYVPGDDLKYVDWKVLARSDRFYSKVFQEETNMNCCLILDASASMGYQGRRAACTKLRYAAMAAACLAYLAARQGDNVGFYAYNRELVSHVPPGRRTGGLPRILTELQRLQPQGTAAHEPVMSHLAENFRRRGVVVLLSDLHEAENALPALLRRFRFAHHECVVFQILDPDEIDLAFGRTTRFVDSETDAEITTYPPLAKQHYLTAMSAFLDKVRLGCLELEADYLLTSTADNLGNMLAAYLHRRKGLA